MSHNQYSGYPCSFVGASTMDMVQVGGATLNPGNSIDQIVPSGSLTRAANITAFADPRFRLSTMDLLTFFTTVSPTVGFHCTGGATFRYQQRANNGTFTGGSSNVTLVSTLGFLVGTGVNAQQDRPAALDATYCALFDGATVPLVTSTGNSFASAPVPAYVSQYYLGPVYVNGVQVEAITSVRFDFGIGLDVIRTDGDVWARKCVIRHQLPTITLSFRRCDVAPSPVTSLFGSAAAGVIAIYLARGLANGTRVAYGSGAHFKASWAGGTYDPQGIVVSGEDDATTELTILPVGAMATAINSTIP